MAALFETLADSQMGNSHRTQETERSPWELSTPVNQEVRLPSRVYSHQCVSLPTIGYTLAHVPLALMFLPSWPPAPRPRTNSPPTHRLTPLPRRLILRVTSHHSKSSTSILHPRRNLMVFLQHGTLPQRQKGMDRHT